MSNSPSAKLFRQIGTVTLVLVLGLGACDRRGSSGPQKSLPASTAGGVRSLTQAQPGAAESAAPADLKPRWHTGGCEGGPLYCFSSRVIPNAPESLAAAMKDLSAYAAYHPGLGHLSQFEGEGLPQAVWYWSRFLYPDSGSAASAAQALGDAEAAKDVDGYHQYLWMVTPRKAVSAAVIDSQRAALERRGLAPKESERDDGNVIVFYGTCLSQAEADSLQARLGAAGTIGVVAKLSFVDADM